MQEDALNRGQIVLWRSVTEETVTYCFAGHLIGADDQHIALHQPYGAPVRRRTGARVGPRGSMLKDGWDGGYQERAWGGAPTVRVHPVGRPYSVIRDWDPANRRFDGWYINLELPWLRSIVGYDSRDLVLDVVATPDLSEWRWKDEEELTWAVGQRILTQGHAAWIRAAGRAAVADLETRTRVFNAGVWDHWVPNDSWPAPRFEANWKSAQRCQTLLEAATLQ